MSASFNDSIASLGLSPQVRQYIELVQTLVQLGSGAYNIVASATGATAPTARHPLADQADVVLTWT